MSGVIYGIIALLGFGFSNALSKNPIQQIGALRMYVLRNSFTSLILFGILLFYWPSQSPSVGQLTFAILLAIMGFVPLYSFLKALEVGKIGLVGPVAYTSSIFTILLSVIFYKESLNLHQSLLLILIVGGIILVSVNFKDLKNSHILNWQSGVPYAVIASVLWGVFFFLNKIPVMALGVVPTAFLVEIGGLVCALTLTKIKKERRPKPAAFSPYLVLPVSILGVVGIIAFNYGISTSNVSIVATVSSATPVIALAYGMLVFRERLTMVQYASTLMILLGIIGLAYYS